ncbi:hypothetical protein [Parasediminibacterium sp. JCM 36343]|uniref:hypothetical protein n=1 Tax=Parasediminibacterium sp. JCM 36343 TaxID=3374279 RepID=UPI00397CAF2B
MKFARLLPLLAFLLLATVGFSQSDYIMLGSRQYDIIDRLQIELRTDSILNFSDVRPYSRKVITERFEYINQLAAEGKITISKADKYNIDLLLKDNFEYTKGFDLKDSILSLQDVFSKPVLTHPPYIGAKKGDFSFYATWYIDYTRGKDNTSSNSLINNLRGIAIRGNINKNIGYYSYISEHQETDPTYVNQYVQKFAAVPGEGFFNPFKENGYDLLNARGGIMFKATKGIDMQFAYDKIFIGDGFRSLIMSDFSNSQLFLKINTRLWKFNYHILYSQLTATHPLSGGSVYSGNYDYPKKYMAFHQIDVQANKWLNIGAFESVMFGRQNGFDLSYLNPIIFYRAVERQNGSPDKVMIGLNIKANPFKNTQLYSQIIVNEFSFQDLKHYGKGSFVNKQGLQLGGKMIDFLGVKNLDIQAEMNIVRPFVYSHYDSVGSYSNYNQPLAHPLGANFREYIGLIKYQPLNKLHLQVKLIYYKQGLDSAGYNFGSNIFRYYSVGRPPTSATNSSPRSEGFFIGSGILAKCFLANISASYEILPFLFLDVTTITRKYSQENAPDFNTNIFNVGIRLNAQKREFDF